jgi:hypothetical protein
MTDEQYLKETKLLDFSHPSLARLAEGTNWLELGEFDKIGAIYRFVRDDIRFGYNESDDIAASRALRDGYGQCNTKTTLLMALLRKAGIPCRIHASAIDKRVQKGVMPDLFYALAPDTLLHTWAEVFFDGRWIRLEGCILDEAYLEKVQGLFPEIKGSFCGFAVAVSDLREPPVSWQGQDTHIQSEAIVQDFGAFDSPDDLYAVHGPNASGVRKLLFKYVMRPWMNRRVNSLRSGQASQMKLRYSLLTHMDWPRACRK